MVKLLFASAPEHKHRNLIAGLGASGFEVVTAHTSAQVWQALIKQEIDSLVLDATLSSDQLDPWRLIREVAELDRPRLILLTRADNSRDRSRAFQSGVCYCLSLPVSPADLCSLLTAVERERHKAQHGAGKASDYADPVLQIDFTNREIRRHDKVFNLTGRELTLMQRLIENAGRASTSEELCKCTWGRRAWPAKRMQLKIQILQLRRKIEHNYRYPRYLISHRGLGYAFMPRSSQ